MRLGIFAKTFPGTTPGAVLEAAGAAGFETVQFNMACCGLPSLPDRVEPATAEAVRAASQASGIGIAALSATYNMIHPDRDQRRAGRESFAALAAAAGAMGTRILTVCTGSCDAQDQWRHHPDNRSAAAWAEMMEEFAQVIPLAERHDLLIGVEPELANVVDSAAAARRLLDEIGSPRLRIVLDPANLAEEETPETRRRIIAEAVDLLAGDLCMAHAKDRDAAGGFVAAGRGVIDFGDFLARLRAAGFDGPVIAHGLAASEAGAAARHLSGLMQAR